MQKNNLITHTFLELLQFGQFLIICIFSVSLKFGECYISCLCRNFMVKNTSIYFPTLSWQHLFFYSKNICCYYFRFLFDRILNFCNRVLTNWKPKGHQKLTVELYVSIELWKIVQSDCLRILLDNIPKLRSFLKRYRVGLQ